MKAALPKSRLLRAVPAILLVVLLCLGGTAMVTGCGGSSDSTAVSPSTVVSAATEAVSVSTVSAASVGTSSTSSPAVAVAAITGPSVVNIRVTGTTPSPFFGDQPYEGIGSGVIYSDDGYIITNAHVVSENDQLADSVEVTFSTGETASARIVATDSFTDIAVIKVDKTGLTPAVFATDSQPTVGEYAIAIGSPLDYSNSVTLGIVSGLGRSIENSGSSALVDLIQTDAAISPGNSGGALVNAQGQVIGINVAYIPPTSSGAENIGFAIPASTAVRVAEELISSGHATHAYLGIGYISVTSDLQEQYRLSRDTGVLITALDPQGPAASAGLKQGDIIVSMEGKTIASASDMILVLRDLEPGDQVSLSVDRGGQTIDLTVTLGERSTSTATTTNRSLTPVS